VIAAAHAACAANPLHDRAEQIPIVLPAAISHSARAVKGTAYADGF